MDAIAAGGRVWYNLSHDCSLTHHGLLWPFPAVRVSQDDLDFVFERVPEADASSWVAVGDVLVRASEKIAKKIGEDLHNRFALRERRYIILVDLFIVELVRSEM